MKELVLATHNSGKLKEFKTLLSPLGFEVKSASELGLLEPEETGKTFEENAKIKAMAAAKASGLMAIADDSGLVIPALGGAPGIYSARWAEGKNFVPAFERIQKELQKASASPAPQAYFICIICLAIPATKNKQQIANFLHQGDDVMLPEEYLNCFSGRIDGTLCFPPRGENGFGYDSIFMPKNNTQTFAEILPAYKNKISHRAMAFEEMLNFLQTRAIAGLL